MQFISACLAGVQLVKKWAQCWVGCVNSSFAFDSSPGFAKFGWREKLIAGNWCSRLVFASGGWLPMESQLHPSGPKSWYIYSSMNGGWFRKCAFRWTLRCMAATSKFKSHFLPLFCFAKFSKYCVESDEGLNAGELLSVSRILCREFLAFSIVILWTCITMCFCLGYGGVLYCMKYPH